MVHHAPPGYTCPFCLLIRGIENSDTQLKQTDIVFQTEKATAFMATRNWKNNAGHVLVVPNLHFENIYDLPDPVLAEIHSLSRRIAVAMRTVYSCDGITLEQSNEPAGDQTIWHYHLHVIARYHNDNFHYTDKEAFPSVNRAVHARKLRRWLESCEEESHG